MALLNPKTLNLIAKACQRKEHLKLTVGIYQNGEKSIQVFDATGEIPNEDFIYEIGSITKTFTVSLLAKLVSEKKVSLEDSIQKYMMGLNQDRYYPTLKRLATHTAGYHPLLPNGKWFRFKLFKGLMSGKIKEGENHLQMDFNQMVQLIHENLLKDKDYPWQYANFGMALVGHAIGAASGSDYWTSMNHFLTEELNLKNTFTGTDPEKNLHGYSIVTNEDLGNWDWGKNLMAPAGDISSTAEDLLEYARINLFEEKAYLSLCHQKYTNAKNYDMGLGWLLQKNHPHLLWHNGGTGGFRSFLGIDKQRKCAVVVLANYVINTDRIGLGILESL